MIADVLSRLEKVRKTGRENWIAACPAHEDKSPSLTIKETQDGKILMHCFAGCSVGEVVGAMGLELDALFPPKPLEYSRAVKRPFPAADVLEALSFECTVVAVGAADIASGNPISEKDRARLWIAFDRIQEGRRLALGQS